MKYYQHGRNFYATRGPFHKHIPPHLRPSVSIDLVHEPTTASAVHCERQRLSFTVPERPRVGDKSAPNASNAPA
ncbi:hypothetical protein ZHAS_00018749 [Anopheles sinensis]|uniref:Uncharacterized protein n=1 Tax=Anopheles sinensis TaxID=74873 RepID=A0A084WKG4_ANOSI|nr:hypothetical protein ZHAS_00018749 [Anopheles sinensis]